MEPRIQYLCATFIGFFGAVDNLAIFFHLLKANETKGTECVNLARQPMTWIGGLVQAAFVVADIVFAALLHDYGKVPF
ncbi:hypothetical protein F5Y16DRAFT_404276 [Xylariaceae sp. FL0255]|nr:hypothetical protein F5Y16DRAFT_404276 [Xylariaceae sp. FL0255]